MTGPPGMARVEVTGEAPLTLALAGEIDLTNADSIRRTVEALVDERPPGAVVLDLTGVDYLDSSGVLMLHRLARRRPAAEGPLRIVVPAGGVLAELLSISAMPAVATVIERPPGRPPA